MDSPDKMTNMATIQMLMLLLLMSVCTFWIGRMIQWLFLRKDLPRKKIFFVLTASLLFSYLVALFFWFHWPQPEKPMFSIFFLPAVIAELIILFITFLIFKRKKHT